MKKMKILAVVAARGRSKGIRNKNVRMLAGKPLIVHALAQAKKWGGYERFVVSTDSGAIAGIARRHGADVPFVRPARLAGDKTGKIDVLRHAMVESERYYGMKFDALLDLDATSPARTVDDIKNVVKLFKNRKADCVFSVVEAKKNPYFNMVEEKRDGSVGLCKKPASIVLSRQTAPRVYEMNASIYIYKRDFLLNKFNKTPYAGRTFAYKMKGRGTLEIDSEDDLKYLEFLVKKGTVKL